MPPHIHSRRQNNAIPQGARIPLSKRRAWTLHFWCRYAMAQITLIHTMATQMPAIHRHHNTGLPSWFTKPAISTLIVLWIYAFLVMLHKQPYDRMRCITDAHISISFPLNTWASCASPSSPWMQWVMPMASLVLRLWYSRQYITYKFSNNNTSFIFIEVRMNMARRIWQKLPFLAYAYYNIIRPKFWWARFEKEIMPLFSNALGFWDIYLIFPTFSK